MKPSNRVCNFSCQLVAPVPGRSWFLCVCALFVCVFDTAEYTRDCITTLPWSPYTPKCDLESMMHIWYWTVSFFHTGVGTWSWFMKGLLMSTATTIQSYQSMYTDIDSRCYSPDPIQWNPMLPIRCCQLLHPRFKPHTPTVSILSGSWDQNIIKPLLLMWTCSEAIWLITYVQGLIIMVQATSYLDHEKSNTDQCLCSMVRVNGQIWNTELLY